MTDLSDPVEVVRRFLKGGSGCQFAARFAAQADGPIFWAQVGIPQSASDDAIVAIDSAFNEAAKERCAVGIVFQSAATEDDLLQVIDTLRAHPRWRVRELVGQDRPPDLTDAFTPYALEWRTEAGDYASVMMMGPFLSFPVHRRCPYLTLMTWTGTRANPFLSSVTSKTSDAIGFVDMPMPESIDEARHKAFWDGSREAAKQLRLHQHVPQNKAARPSVGFCLSAQAAARFNVGDV
jgi:hypothetical protein